MKIDEEKSIASEIGNGDFCEDCCAYLGDGDGFPRKCKDCK